MTKARIPSWLYLSMMLTALLCLFSLWQRYQAESLNKAVGLITEIDLTSTLAASQKLSLRDGLLELKKQGLTGIVLPEETVSDLIADGRAQIVPGQIGFAANDAGLRERVSRGLSNRFGMFVAPGDNTIAIGELGAGLVRSTAIGMDPALARLAQDEGLFIVTRMSNPAGASSEYVANTIEWAAELGATIFLPQGEQVLGRRDAMAALQESLAASKMSYATPEFAKIGGDANVVQGSPELVIRLHSAQSQELDKLPIAVAVERYGKAAAERNQRLLLIRPVSNAADQPLTSFGDFIGKIRHQIEREGYKAGVPHPFVDSGVQPLVFVLIAIWTLPVWFFFFSQLIPERFRTWRYVGLGLIALLAVGCLNPTLRGIFALLASMLFPLLAFLLLDLATPKNLIVGFLRTSAVSLVGGLCVGGLLNGLPYFVRAEVFEGVKVSHFAPIGLIGLYFFWRLTSAKEALKSPILWSQAGLSLVVLVAFVFMASRTGNDNPAGVSGVELQFRALLDQLLYVRPRTKEFLVGHPAMIIAIAMLMRLRRDNGRYGGWVALFMTVGAIGQTSMVNTLCHLHTPLALSFARIGVGLLLGGILGLALWGLLGQVTTKRT